MIASERDPVVITGYGVVSAAGRGAAALRRALEANACHLAPLDDAITRGLAVREGGAFTEDLAPHGDADLDSCRFARLCRLAAAEALEHAGIGAGPLRVGLALGTALAGIDADTERDSGSRAVAHRPDRILEELARNLVLSGPLSVVSATCVSALYALERAIAELERDPSLAMLCGGADTLGRFMQAGFSSLGTLVTEPDAAARPLGGRFLLGEAAAFVVLETRASALARGARILGVIEGRSIRADARHLTSPDPEGAAMTSAIEAALAEAGRLPDDVGHVSLTAVNSPPYERLYRSVLARVFANREIPTATWEASIGHGLAASGTLGLVHALFILELERQRRVGESVLALTVGFGGQNGAALIAPATEVARPRTGRTRIVAAAAEEVAAIRLSAWASATASPRDLEDWFPGRWSPSRAIHAESAVLAHAAALALEAAGWWRRGSGLAIDGGLILGADFASRAPALRFRRALESESRGAVAPTDFLFSLPSSPAAILGILFGLALCQATVTHHGLSGFRALSFGLDLVRASRPRRVLVGALSALGPESVDALRRAGEPQGAEAAPFTMAAAVCLEAAPPGSAQPGDIGLEACADASEPLADGTESIATRALLEDVPPAVRGLAAPSLLALARLASDLVREPRRAALTHEDPCSGRSSRLIISASSGGERGTSRERTTWSPKNS